MIRPVRTRLVVLVAILAVASAGMPPLVAATSEGARLRHLGWEKFAAVDNNQGVTPNLDKVQVLEGEHWVPSTPLSSALVEQMRQHLLAGQKSADPKIAVTAKRALQWLDIASATTASERHDRIRQLPVTVARSAASDGRIGTVTSYVAGGKTRLKIFTPTLSQYYSSSELGTTEPPSGPSAGAPPAGRECYEGGQPADCATEEELEDVAIATAALGSEIDSSQAEYDAITGEIESYCSQNPWDCGDTSAEAMTPASGPAAAGYVCGSSKCYEQAVNALMALGGAGVTYLGVSGSIIDASATGVIAASSLTVAAWYGAVALASFGLGYFGYNYYTCWRQREAGTQAEFDVPYWYAACVLFRSLTANEIDI